MAGMDWSGMESLAADARFARHVRAIDAQRGIAPRKAPTSTETVIHIRKDGVTVTIRVRSKE